MIASQNDLHMHVPNFSVAVAPMGMLISISKTGMQVLVVAVF